MVQGMGGFIDVNNLTAPENPRAMGVAMRDGRSEMLQRPRRNGPAFLWQTSSERAVEYHHRQSETLP